MEQIEVLNGERERVEEYEFWHFYETQMMLSKMKSWYYKTDEHRIFLETRFILYLIMCLCLCVCVFVPGYAGDLRGWKRVPEPLGAGIPGGCEPPKTGAGNWT